MRLIKILIASLILATVFCRIVSAQEIPEVTQDEEVTTQDLEISEPKVLPDSPLYFLKNWGRAIRLFFAFNRVKKAGLRLKFANEKIIEAEKLAELKRNPRAIEKVLASFENDIDKISELSGEELKQFSEKLFHQQLLHQKILQRLENQVSDEIAERIKEKRMAHLEKFVKVMEKVEEREKIAERLGKELEGMKGSEFKDFKKLEILDEIKEKVPEDVKDKIEELKSHIIENFIAKLEGVSNEEKEKFINYLEQIHGNKLKHLEIMSSLEANEMSGILKEKIEKAKEKKIEEIAEERGISATTAQAQITKAEDEIKKAQELVATTSENEYGGRAARKLLELAKKHLEKAKEAFNEGKYGRAFGLAIASYHEALNAERIVEKIEKIKQSPQALREKFEKLYPGIELPENIQNCPLPVKPECGEGEVWRIGKNENGCPVFICEKVREKERLREESPEVCPMVWDPVCGKNGKTYSNECMARAAGIEIDYEGVCKEKIEKIEIPLPLKPR